MASIEVFHFNELVVGGAAGWTSCPVRAEPFRLDPNLPGLELLMSPRIALHPDAEKAAEDYLLKRMPTDQIQAYELHLRH